MDNELVSNSLSEIQSDQSRGGSDTPTPRSYSEIFEEKFPYYLSIGMTAEQYWDGDVNLPKYYRKAEELRKERVNQEAWLQGMYIYDVILRTAPILQAFAKKGTKPKPYVEEPYPISKKKRDDVQQRKEKKISDKGLAKMQAFMTKTNKHFNKGSE